MSLSLEECDMVVFCEEKRERRSGERQKEVA